ncbi:MAG: F-box protein [Parachlamydia sp.]|nr:F-box protein [Parachlamydia sp.]
MNQFVTGNANVEQTIGHIKQLSQDLTTMTVNQIDELATSLMQEASINLSAQRNFADAFSACSVNIPLRSQLANQVFIYFDLLNQKVDLKPLNTLLKQPVYLTTLPEPLLVQIVEQMDLLELARLSQTCRRLHATIADPLASFKSFWEDLSALIYSLEEVSIDSSRTWRQSACLFARVNPKALFAALSLSP